MSEQALQQRLRLALSRGATRLWRNNTGALRDANGQLVRYGLCPGSSDLIGYTSVVVTPEMVGQRLAVFCAIEVKTARGRATAEQVAFLEHLQHAGARVGIARSIDEAAAILQG